MAIGDAHFDRRVVRCDHGLLYNLGQNIELAGRGDGLIDSRLRWRQHVHYVSFGIARAVNS